MFTLISSWFRRMAPRLPRESKERKLMPESKIIVQVTETGILVHRPEGQTEAVLFEDLAAVLIETNDSGPWGTDVWWILLGKDLKSGCVYPGGATGEGEALTALQRLPEFDNNVVIQAMSSCENAKFLCWQREWSQSTDSPSPDSQTGGPVNDQLG